MEAYGQEITSRSDHVLAVAFTATAADLTGKWAAQVVGRNGNTQMTFDLKADGATITGTVTGGGGAPTANPISDSKIDGDKVTFSVKIDRNGQTMVTTYTGTFSGDDLKLKQTRQGRNGEQTTDVAAKRSTFVNR